MNSLHRLTNTYLPYTISAFVLAVAFDYPKNFGWLGCLSLLPIIHRLYHKNFVDKHDYIGMFLFGFITNILSTLWMADMYPLSWINIHNNVLSATIISIVWLVLSTIMSLPFLFWPKIFIYIKEKVLSPVTTVILASGSWSLLEFVRSTIIAIGLYHPSMLFGPHYTYYSLGYLVANLPIYKYTLPIGGIYLASFTVVFTNFLLFYLFFLRKTFLKYTIYLASTTIFLLLFSWLYVFTIRYKDKDRQTINLYLVQSSLPSSYNQEVYDKKVAEALYIIKSIPKGSVVVFPENIDLLSQQSQNSQYLQHLSLVIGSRSETNKKREEMYYLNPTNQTVALYIKQLLMPIGEYKIWYLEWIIKLLGHNTLNMEFDKLPSNVIIPNTSSVYHMDDDSNTIFGSSICSENISPYIFRNSTLSGANILLNIASLAPFHNSELLNRQTMQINTTRALENGRYLITASNMGESFVVSDTGIVTHRMQSNTGKQMDVDKVNVQSKGYKTPYTSYGDYIQIVFTCLLVYYLLLKK